MMTVPMMEITIRTKQVHIAAKAAGVALKQKKELNWISHVKQCDLLIIKQLLALLMQDCFELKVQICIINVIHATCAITSILLWLTCL